MSNGWRIRDVQSESWIEYQTSNGLAAQRQNVLRETAPHIERLLLAEHVIAGTRQLVGQRFAGHDAIGPGAFVLVESLGLGTETQCKAGCFNECPGQVFVAVLHVAFSFLLSVGHACAIDATAI